MNIQRSWAREQTASQRGTVRPLLPRHRDGIDATNPPPSKYQARKEPSHLCRQLQHHLLQPCIQPLQHSFAAVGLIGAPWLIGAATPRCRSAVRALTQTAELSADIWPPSEGDFVLLEDFHSMSTNVTSSNASS